VRLVWSAPALADREQIFDYLEAENPRAAIAIDERISAHMGLLMQFPEHGRPGRIEETRESVINRTPYILAYRIHDKAIIILRILHGAQLWPDPGSV